MSHKDILKKAVVSSVALGVMTAVNAQESGDGLAIDEITVTARKRQELLIEVPMNIAVIGAAEISSRNLVTKEDIYRSVAGAAAPGGPDCASFARASSDCTQVCHSDPASAK